MNGFAVWTREERLISGITMSNLIILQGFLLAFRNVKTMSLCFCLNRESKFYPKTRNAGPVPLPFCELARERSRDFHHSLPRSAPRLGVTRSDSPALGNKMRRICHKKAQIASKSREVDPTVRLSV